ncbi:MAG: ChbG/HpnK family deacetylase [Actinomycetota bacterium]|nr:ChbG/HpnK family deacetylase [Actinomycetota bacterium]MDQ3240102.1 ChbG/HpnK family deacetylase [Actinomycetota bacterium]
MRRTGSPRPWYWRNGFAHDSTLARPGQPTCVDTRGPPRPPRYLIVNADDFGASPGVNRGILEAHARE